MTDQERKLAAAIDALDLPAFFRRLTPAGAVDTPREALIYRAHRAALELTALQIVMTGPDWRERGAA